MAKRPITKKCNRERGVAMVQVLVMTPFLIVMFILLNYVGQSGQTHLRNRNFVRECIWQYAQAGCPPSGMSPECQNATQTTSVLNVDTQDGSSTVRAELDDLINDFQAHDPGDLLENGAEQLELRDLTLSRSTQLPSNALVGASSLVANLGLYCNTVVPPPPAEPIINQFESTVCETFRGFCDEI